MMWITKCSLMRVTSLGQTTAQETSTPQPGSTSPSTGRSTRASSTCSCHPFSLSALLLSGLVCYLTYNQDDVMIFHLHDNSMEKLLLFYLSMQNDTQWHISYIKQFGWLRFVVFPGAVTALLPPFVTAEHSRSISSQPTYQSDVSPCSWVLLNILPFGMIK